ncbi:urea amidolyase family protein [Halomonas binhaiensis]|uniref:5-oxoprolinase/urea amidolyase family protein n=1 Tax=Halomonas binhaiensis TaxID=2562282 RepID=A0A5C1NEW8_9GAMM|nr:urea amidolyase family protein [Halomonas binhaiensis]QEM81173.1 5-oxoprolinase/urea amidolyase family protein [Halomonas binhaiensis]
MRFLPVNSHTLMVELEDLQQTLSLFHALQRAPIKGIVELVPAARTLLTTFQPEVISRQHLIEQLAGCDLDQGSISATRHLKIPVHYEGEDLKHVAELLGISSHEVIQRHTQSTYHVAFSGFAPGFAYLSSDDSLLNVPRRSEPRTRIPPGAVALAGAFSGIYPKASPGGWQIIGHTSLNMWDLDRTPPALLQPGDQVHFVDAGPSPRTQVPVGENCPASPSKRETASGRRVASSGLEITATGLQALFQDQGRPGQASQGISRSGAMDRGALRQANRLVGNDADQAGIELVHGGFQCISRGEQVVAITGADVPLMLKTADGRQWPLLTHQPVALADGDTLTLGSPRAGIRAYLAIRGGFQEEAVVGSRSSDTLAGIGPAPLAVGDILAVSPHPLRRAVAAPEVPIQSLPTLHDVVMLDVELGPRTDWFNADAIHMLTQQEWQITAQSDRVGLRLKGEAPLTRRITHELPSEGTVRGAIQVPSNGQPVLFMADHPLTGGYPVIACVARHHLDLAGQLPVGARVRFNPITAFEAKSIDD